jgi:hypothetical protein
LNEEDLEIGGRFSDLSGELESFVVDRLVLG